MSESPIIAKGRGYQDDTTFDGFEVIAEPCPTRESRDFPSAGGGPGVTYASHSLKLAVRELQSWEKPTARRPLFILLEHGGGRRVIALPRFYDQGAWEAALIALPERVQYAALHSIARLVEDADRAAREETAREYAAAFIDGRLKKSRPRQGRRYVTIEPKLGAAA